MESDIVLKQARCVPDSVSRIWNLILVVCIWHKHFISGNAELNSNVLSQNLVSAQTFIVEDYVKVLGGGTTAALVSMHLCLHGSS